MKLILLSLLGGGACLYLIVKVTGWLQRDYHSPLTHLEMSTERRNLMVWYERHDAMKALRGEELA